MQDVIDHVDKIINETADPSELLSAASRLAEYGIINTKGKLHRKINKLVVALANVAHELKETGNDR